MHGARAGRGPAHRVPGGRLPQHLRVLGGPRGHLPHRRRAVHAPLRLLPDRHRPARADSTATSRAASPSRCARWACATPRSPASPATTCPTRAPGCTPRPSAQIHELNPGTGVEVLIPDFSGNPELLGEVFDAAPRRCSRTTSRPCPRLFKRIRPAFTLRALASTSSPRPAPPAWSPSRTSSSAWARRSTRCTRRCATCTTPAATSSRSPSTCARRRGTTPSTRWVKPEEFVELADDATEHRLRRRHERAAGALELPRRPALRPGDRGARRLAGVTAASVATHVWPDGAPTPTPSGRARRSTGAAPFGDRHHGETMLSDTRQSRVFAKGTVIRNHRQVSLVAVEELAVVAAAIGLPGSSPG